jgi:levanbiose-producing levanase
MQSFRTELFRPQFHLSPYKKWCNDCQRPIFVDGKYHYYYLHNKDYSTGNGTEWRHATSEDLVHWEDCGIAIPKYTTINGDIWTGCTVIDKDNTAGFGYGAIIAIVSQCCDKYGESVCVWYSLDGGYHFISYSDEPVMINPTGSSDFRDPKVFWHEPTHKWVMVLAEGQKIGFYSSPNLKNWTYMDSISSHFDYGVDIGINECPDLFELKLDGNIYNTKWILTVGCNDFKDGKNTNLAYWVGWFDGDKFVPDCTEPSILDGGSDFYTSVTWEDSDTNKRLDYRFIIGWMNEWDYAKNIPTVGWQGNYSIPRLIDLRTINGKPTLIQNPVNLDSLIESTKEYPSQILNDTNKIFEWKYGQSFMAEYYIDLWKTTANNLSLTVLDNGINKTSIDYDFQLNQISVNRALCGNGDIAPTFSKLYSSKVIPKDNHIRIRAIVDCSTVEIFVNDGETVLTSLTLPSSIDCNFVSLWASGGDVNLVYARLSKLNSIWTEEENEDDWI